MVGVYQNFNDSLATVKLPSKFEVSMSTHYEDIKGDTNVTNGVVWVVSVIQGHRK